MGCCGGKTQDNEDYVLFKVSSDQILTHLGTAIKNLEAAIKNFKFDDDIAQMKEKSGQEYNPEAEPFIKLLDEVKDRFEKIAKRTNYFLTEPYMPIDRIDREWNECWQDLQLVRKAFMLGELSFDDPLMVEPEAAPAIAKWNHVGTAVPTFQPVSGANQPLKDPTGRVYLGEYIPLDLVELHQLLQAARYRVREDPFRPKSTTLHLADALGRLGDFMHAVEFETGAAGGAGAGGTADEFRASESTAAPQAAASPAAVAELERLKRLYAAVARVVGEAERTQSKPPDGNLQPAVDVLNELSPGSRFTNMDKGPTVFLDDIEADINPQFMHPKTTEFDKDLHKLHRLLMNSRHCYGSGSDNRDSPWFDGGAGGAVDPALLYVVPITTLQSAATALQNWIDRNNFRPGMGMDDVSEMFELLQSSEAIARGENWQKEYKDAVKAIKKLFDDPPPACRAEHYKSSPQSWELQPWKDGTAGDIGFWGQVDHQGEAPDWEQFARDIKSMWCLLEACKDHLMSAPAPAQTMQSSHQLGQSPHDVARNSQQFEAQATSVDAPGIRADAAAPHTDPYGIHRASERLRQSQSPQQPAPAATDPYAFQSRQSQSTAEATAADPYGVHRASERLRQSQSPQQPAPAVTDPYAFQSRPSESRPSMAGVTAAAMQQQQPAPAATDPYAFQSRQSESRPSMAGVTATAMQQQPFHQPVQQRQPLPSMQNSQPLHSLGLTQPTRQSQQPWLDSQPQQQNALSVNTQSLGATLKTRSSWHEKTQDEFDSACRHKFRSMSGKWRYVRPLS